MAQYIEINSPVYGISYSNANTTLQSNPCVCCLAQKEFMINLTKCKHNGFLQEYLAMPNRINILVCNICHEMLKKILMFKKQVEQSNRILKLKQQTLQKTTNTIFNLQQSDTTITSTLTDTEEESDLKLESGSNREDVDDSTNPNSAFEITTDVKIEHECSDFENDLPLAQIKKRKTKQKKPKVASLEEKYEGKIRVVFLSNEDVMKERERQSKKESYLKLPFKCESCIKGFDHEITLKSHIENKHEKEGVYRCYICKSVLGSEPSFKEHARRHVRRFECVTCGKRTTDIYSISQHYNQQHGAGDASHGITMQFSCDQCDYTTDSHRAYRYHREKHKQKQQCNICGNTFVSSGGLRVHMYTVHKQSTRVYKCSSCDKTYKCKSGLFNHTACAHGGSQRAYCAKCRTHYATKNNLLHHLRTHSAHVTDENKKFVCHECDAKFLNKSALQAHIDWDHLKTVKYECNKCSKVFKTAVTLKRHTRFVHEKKRPPRDKICDYCGRAFTTTSILVSHIRTHTGERPLKCTHCAATFAHCAALYTHNKLIHNK